MLILTVYSACEVALKSGATPSWFLAGAASIAILHLSYYQIFLNRFADHRGVVSQWEGYGLYGPSIYVPLLSIVICLAAVRLFGRPGPRAALRDARVRLLLVWFLVVFALTQHNLILKPKEPIHFARGNDWTALFFLGAPVLILILERVLQIRRGAVRYATLCLFVAFLLSDNLVWYGRYFAPGHGSIAVNLSRDQWSVLEWLNHNASPPQVVVCQDSLVNFLVSTYTRVRSCAGQWDNTPNSELRHQETRQAFAAERFIPEWDRIPVLYVSLLASGWKPPPGFVELFHNHRFAVWGRR